MSQPPESPAPDGSPASPDPERRRDPSATLSATPRTLGRAGAVLVGVSVALVLLLAGITVAGRVDRAPPSTLILLVTLLPYLYALTATWLFTLWTAAPDRTLPPVLLTATCVGALALWGPSWAARPQVAEGEDLVLMNWNLRRLWGGPDDGGDPLGCAVKAIEDAQPDVLALQEVSANDVAALSKALGLHCAHATYTSGGGPKAGGLATCVRGSDWTLTGSGQRFVDPRDWHYVFAEVARNGRVFNLLAVHLHPYELAMNDWTTVGERGQTVQAAQSDQATALLQRMAKLSDPTLVAGDFNSTRDAALHVGLRRHLTDAWERGGLGFGGTVELFELAPLRVDYVYASEAFAVRGAEVGQARCSDHKPVIASLTLRDAL